MSEYKGHLPNGNPVQQHSAGEYYPCILFQRGLDADTRYYILFDGIDYCMGKEQEFQVQTAEQVIQISTAIDPEDSRDIREQKLKYTKHKRHQVLLEASDTAANKERAAEPDAPVEVKLDSEMFPLYYSIIATAKRESMEAIHYVRCLQEVLKAAMHGDLSCCVAVPRHLYRKIGRSLQQMGFEVQYKCVLPTLTELKLTWAEADAAGQ